MISKYGTGEHIWFPNSINSSYGVGVWKGIRKGRDSFGRDISFDIGDGSTVRFWNDIWCGEVELRRVFPNLFNLALDKDCLVSSVLQISEGGIV